MKTKVGRYPKGSRNEIKDTSIKKENILKIKNRLSEYIEEHETRLSKKELLTEDEIAEVLNLNRILENKEKYEEEDKISKTAIEKNKVKLEEINKVLSYLEENNIEEYDSSESIDISEVEDLE